LVTAIEAFVSAVGLWTVPIGGGLYKGPVESDSEHAERMAARNAMNDGAERVCEAYDALAKSARRKLSA
jgi:hypothetical protein